MTRRDDPLIEMIVKSVQFANLAAGEGLSIDGLTPEEFLLDYSEAKDFEDWDCLADHVRNALIAQEDAAPDIGNSITEMTPVIQRGTHD